MPPLPIAISLTDADFIVRALHDGERSWFAMVDLFGLVSKLTASDGLPRPTRAPVALLARVCRCPADYLVRKYKDFECPDNQLDMAMTAQLVANEGVMEFMRLSGLSDEQSVGLAKDLIDTANTARAANPAEAEKPVEPENELSSLKARLAKVEHELAYQAKRTSALERSFEVQLRQFQMRLNLIEEQASQSKHGETSRELKAHANRLYARSKQLENEGL